MIRTLGLIACSLLLGLAACDDGEPQSPTPTPVDASPRPDQRVEADRGQPDAAPADAGRPDAQPDMGCVCPGQQTCDDDGACVEPERCAGHIDCRDDRRCHEGQCRDRCRESADCATPGTHCDPLEQVCTDARRCQRDIDCGDDLCVEGLCQPRCTDERCPGRQQCDPGTGRCVEGDGCDTADDCLGARRCQAGTCVSPCREAADCAGAQTCEAGVCTEPAACTADTDCVQARVCADGRCADPCTLAGCPGGQVCEPTDGRCGEAQPCADDAGCFDGRRCDAGACVDPCREAADCAGAQTCDAGHCTEPAACTGDLDCLGARRCTNGACADRCTPDSCPGAQICDAPSGQCLEADPCADDAGCFAGRSCQDGRCVAPCAEHADCPGAMRCDDGQCREPSPCNGPADCLGERLCIEGVCLDRCLDGRCPGERACVNNACVEAARCAADADCDGPRTCLPGVAACTGPCPCDGDQRCVDGRCLEPDGCAADADCLGDRTCRLGACTRVSCDTHAQCGDDRCVGFACDAPPAPDCPAGWQAVNGYCQAAGPCAADADCPGRCDAGRCVGCLADADCPGATVCVAGQCANPEHCDGPADCVPGSTCAEGTCVLDPCADDRVLDNHTAADAAALPVDLVGLHACEARADWFAVRDPVGVRIVARFPAGRAPLALALFSADAPAGPPVDTSVAAPGSAWVSAGPGDYLVRVTAPAGASGAYDLRVDSGVACADDRFERPWRNDDAARAAPIGPGSHAGRLCPGDADWFRYDGPPGTLEIDGARARVGDAVAPAPIQPGALIQVDQGEAYTLTVREIADPAQRCAAAPELPLGTTVITVDAAQPDSFAPPCQAGAAPDGVWRVVPPQAGQLTVRLLDPDPNVRVALHTDCAGPALACGDDWRVAVAGQPYFVVVDGPYRGRIEVRLAEAPALCADPAALQPGAPVAVAPMGPPADLGGGCLDPTRPTAAYRLDVAEASQITLSLDTADPGAALSLRTDCADAASEHTCSSGAGPTLDERLEPGSYVVLVQGAGQLQLRSAPDVVPIRFEAMCFPAAAGPTFEVGDQHQLTGSTAAAGSNFGECGAPGADQVLQFSLAARARVRVTAASAAFVPVVSVLGDDCFGAAQCGAGSAFDAVLPAGSWALVVDAAEGAGDFTVDLRVLGP